MKIWINEDGWDCRITQDVTKGMSWTPERTAYVVLSNPEPEASGDRKVELTLTPKEIGRAMGRLKLDSPTEYQTIIEYLKEV